MRIVGPREQDLAGVGGALRGQEMGYALRKLGHEIVPLSSREMSPYVSSGGDPDLDAVIIAGTWHQLINRNSYVIAVAHAADAQGIACIWWYGSNGSVFGSTNPDPAIRKADEQHIIDLIAERPFIAAICPYSMDIYERHGLPREKMRLVPSVFDADLFCPAVGADPECLHISERLRSKFGVPPGAFTIGTVGNTPNSKGGDDVLRAVALLADMPDLHYLILHSPELNLSGQRARSPDGLREGKSERDVLNDSKALAVSLGIADRVHFLGMRFPRTAMPQFYRLLDVYCSPSKAENLGQPLVESQLCGKILVTYKGFSFDFVCAPTAEQIPTSGTETDDYGLIIPECDPAVLADAIRNARHKAEDARARWLTRKWTAEKFGHHNAARMVEAIEEYRAMIGVRPREATPHRQLAVGPQNDAMIAGYHAAAERIEAEIGKPTHKVLDVGCNTGDGMGVLAKRWPDAQMVGVDPVRRFVYAAIGRGFYARIAEAEKLPFSDDSFAFVFSRHSLEHCHDRAAAVAECRRILAPGGHIYVQAPIEPEGTANKLHESAFQSLDELRNAFPGFREVYWGPQPTVGEYIGVKE